MQKATNAVRRVYRSAALFIVLGMASPSLAETSEPSALSLLEAMVVNGVLTQEQANKILEEAKARDAARAAEEAVPPLPEGAKRVVYVPEIVKQELRDEIKEEVLAEAERENWAAPNTHPEWTERVTLYGDVRGRYEWVDFPDGNVTGVSPDFNAINTGDGAKLVAASGYLLDQFTPELNVDEDRNRARVRARVGVDAELADGFSTGLRLASGSSNSPVSTNQTLGGSGGNFSKYEIWLDRAFINWQAFDEEDYGLSLNVGRFDNPFFGTDLVWDDDLGFDGAAVSGRYQVTDGVTPFLTAGAFPVFNSDFNFSSYQTEKTDSSDKWLYGVQGGTTWTPTDDLNVTFGAAYYFFDGVEGRVSSPCQDAFSADGSCDTDETRPSFAQKGNTYMALRDLTPITNIGILDAYQYYGLATEFQELAITAAVDYDGFDPLNVRFEGEFVKNLGFDAEQVAAKAVNNFGSGSEFEGGDIGYLGRIAVGSQSFDKLWDWNASFAYKYVESDAVVDGLTDSDFGLGGTNLKGFIIGGELALAHNVWASAKWMTADNIEGIPFSVDIFQANLSAKF